MSANSKDYNCTISKQTNF